MLVRHARAIAHHWVFEDVANLPGFLGAYFAGSTGWLPEDAILPSTSDLDINVVFTHQEASVQRGKVLYRGVLLDVTPLPMDPLQSPGQVLGHYHLAGGFRAPSIISDASGHLTTLHAAVSREFAHRRWVRARCEHARRRVLDGLAALNRSAPFPNQVMAWIFPTGVTTHILLSAGLRNPTVRRRYLAVRELLTDYDYLPLYEMLLDLQGSARLTRTQAERHLAALTEVFDAARTVVRTPFSFASDISAIARPLAIDGSRELIARGFHREAMFWIAVTYSRCQCVLAADAPHLQGRFEWGYGQLLADLGIASFDDLWQRGEQVMAYLEPIWEAAEAIMAANPNIQE